MLAWMVTVGATELGKAMFEQVLKLGQSAAEDYVKDFFKGCLQEGITAAKPEVARKAVAEALQAFLLLITDELEDQELSRAEIRDRFDLALTQFVQDDSVKPILGKAFEKECKAIDATALSTLWQQSTFAGRPFPALPEAFDWQRISHEYLRKVRRIIRETPELRSLLHTDLLENIAHNTTQLSPGFDIATYRRSLQSSYGYLKLYTLDSTDRVDAIKLWAMFIEQRVREALPPTRYDLPGDVKHQLQAAGHLETDLSPEALEHYHHEYFQQPAQKVLAAIADSQRAVILGDPGSGKSSLLQYLALDWVEGKTEKLPLLIELREFAINPSVNFLEFLHRGRGVDWQFDQQQLHQHLLEFPTLVMFDGLDEVFDRTTQSTVIDDIMRFSQQYPKAQVLVTSRIIGYNPDRLQHSSFRHFTIQSLNADEMHEFIDRWYDLSMGSDPDKARLKQRLKDAIANSRAIANLADNPLLLTMMAILNRRQELPRDRADLYDQASRVLLYHWDVDHKRLHIPMDAIGRREKQEMLRLIAYEMQTSEEGLKGNLISSDRLTRILTNYLRDQGFSEPREKANRLIQQLRERNFILCYRGADTYGFMHRTFLEYFCTVEIVDRFEKQRTLTFEQLRDEVFGQHWQDETWHEVLRLICGAIDPSLASGLIKFLIDIEINKNLFLEEEYHDFTKGHLMKPEGLMNLFLAVECLQEIHSSHEVSETYEQLLNRLKQEVITESPYPFRWDTANKLTNTIAMTWSSNLTVFDWLKTCIDKPNSYVAPNAIIAIANVWKDKPDVLPWLKSLAQTHSYFGSRDGALRALAQNWKSDPEVFTMIKTAIHHDNHPAVRTDSISALVSGWKDDPEILPILKAHIHKESSTWGRQTTIRLLTENWKDDSEVIAILLDRALNDPDEQLREWAQEQLKNFT